MISLSAGAVVIVKGSARTMPPKSYIGGNMIRPFDIFIFLALLVSIWIDVFQGSNCTEIKEVRHIYQTIPDDIRVMRGME